MILINAIKKFSFLVFIVGVISCGIGKSVKNAEIALEAKQYSVAIEYLLDDYRNGSKREKPIIANKLGDTYLILREYEEAKKWFKKSFDKEKTKANILGLVKSSKNLEQYEESLLYLKELEKASYDQNYISNEYKFLKEAIRRKGVKDDTVDVELARFSERSSDYSPVFFRNDFIIFTSDRQESAGSDDYLWTGYSFSDFFITSKYGRRNTKNFDAIFNSDANEGTICFNKDFTEAIFSRCPRLTPDKESYCKLYSSQLIEDYWSEPQLLNICIEGYNYGHPVLFENDSLLIFSSDQDSGFGSHDLFYSERLEEGNWSSPYAFPEVINTRNKEMFPTVDGDTLYFSSDKNGGLGGLDIYKTYLDRETNKWSFPEPLPVPFNSGADDFGLITDRSSEDEISGYFSSGRRGDGVDDIFFYRKNGQSIFTKKPTKKDTTTSEVEQDIFVLITTIEDKYEDSTNPNSSVIGKSSLAGVKIDIQSTNDSLTLRSDDDGKAFKELLMETNYVIKASKKGYLNRVVDLSTMNIDFEGQNSQTINLEIKMDKIFVGQEIVLQNIYYDFNKWDIRKDAEPTLDQLSELLHANPDIKIELGSHTDCRGEDKYNLDLSQKRAESVVQYLINKGIDPERVIPKGYGETQPNILCDCDNCSDEDHQENRRTSFIIIE